MSFTTVFIICPFPSVKRNIFFPHMLLAADIWELYLHFKRRKVKYTAGWQALSKPFEECFQCSHASWASQINLYSPPKAHLNKPITISFVHGTLTCTTNPTHFAYTDILNVFVLIFLLSFVFMSLLDSFGNQYSGLNLPVLETSRQKSLSLVHFPFEPGIAHIFVGDTAEEFWWQHESDLVHL